MLIIRYVFSLSFYNSMGCILGQQDETGKKEYAIYYLSKKFIDYESRYSMLEQTCCAPAWEAKDLRQYMLNYTTWLISKMDPIKYIFEKPALTGRISRWQMLLSDMISNTKLKRLLKVVCWQIILLTNQWRITGL